MGQTASRAPWSESVEGRLKGARKARLHLAELEGLESRTLLATIPAATATAGPQNLSNLVGDVGGINASQSSSTVAIDPTDPSKLVAVWIDNDPTMSAITDWRVPGRPGGRLLDQWWPELAADAGRADQHDRIPVRRSIPALLDPTTSGPTLPYIDVTNPSLGFDDSGNFYILSEYHNAGSSGAIVLQKYDFTGSTPLVAGFHHQRDRPAIPTERRLRLR